MVAVSARRDPADDRVVVPDRLVADDVGGRVGVGLDDHRDQAPRGATRSHFRLVGGPADEVVVESQVAGDPALGRRVDRPVLAEPCPVALLEAKRHQRAHPEKAQAVRLTGGHDLVEQLALVLRRDPQLVAEVSGVVDPREVDRRHPEVDPPERHEREGFGRQVQVGRDGLEHVPRARPGN